MPPADVAHSATAIKLRAGKRSANGPPKKYDTMATMPYTEKAEPNSRLEISNTCSKVGLNTLARTNGRKKMASPASIKEKSVR